MSLDTGHNENGLALRVLVCDDESLAREYLKLVLGRIGGIEIVGEASDACDCMKQIGACRPDVVFLDINMPDQSGMEVAKALSNLTDPPKMVFVTGYDDYAISAFEVAAAGYIMKPYDQSRLEKTIRRLKDVNGRTLLSTELSAQIGFHKLPVKDQDSVKLIDPKHICFIRTQGRKTCIRTKNSSYLTQYTLGELEKRLGIDNFFRANEGCLVNLEYVKEVVYYGPRNYELLMGDPEETYVPLSRSRAQKLKEMLDL